MTFGGSDLYPLWTPDGSRITFLHSLDSTILSTAADGTGEAELIAKSPAKAFYLPTSWSPDGRKLFFIDTAKPERPLMEVDVAEGESFICGMPRVVIDDLTRYVPATAPLINWDTDGERFAFVELLRNDDSLSRIEVTLDWGRQLSVDTTR